VAAGVARATVVVGAADIGGATVVVGVAVVGGTVVVVVGAAVVEVDGTVVVDTVVVDVAVALAGGAIWLLVAMCVFFPPPAMETITPSTMTAATTQSVAWTTSGAARNCCHGVLAWSGFGDDTACQLVLEHGR
jgi:phosphate/sulfate permease